MKLKWLFLVLAWVAPIFSQVDDGCEAARQSFQEIRDSFTRNPDIFNYRLAYSSLVTATRNCPDDAELWYMRSVFGRKGGAPQKDIDQSYEKAKEEARKYKPGEPPSEIAKVAGNLSKPIKQKWALVIGLNKFKSSRVRSLKYSAVDAVAFRDILVDQSVGRFSPSNVHLLTDDQATLTAIKEQIGWLRKNALPDDLVVVYIASHGTTISDDPRGANYIVTYDSKLDNPEAVYGSTIQMLSLVHELNEEIQAFRVILVLDTCLSGDATTAQVQAAVLSENLSRVVEFRDSLRIFQSGAGRVVMTSAAADQPAQESDELKHGYFTYFLIDALRNSGGHVLIKDLYDQVRTATEKTVKQCLDKAQTPLFAAGPSAISIVIGAQPSL